MGGSWDGSWELGWVPFPPRHSRCDPLTVPFPLGAGMGAGCVPPPLGATPRPHPAGPGSLGRCFSEWQCQDGHNGSAMSRAECCQHPWGHSWRRGDTGDTAGPCLPCTRLPLGGDGGSPRHRSPPATCQAWAGTRIRTFDGRHFSLAGSCRYSLATATDGTWDVTIGLGHPRVRDQGAWGGTQSHSWCAVGWDGHREQGWVTAAGVAPSAWDTQTLQGGTGCVTWGHWAGSQSWNGAGSWDG